VCVLAFNVVEALFPAEDPIGKTINVGGRTSRVGTVKKQKAARSVGEIRKTRIFIPYWDVSQDVPFEGRSLSHRRMREGENEEASQYRTGASARRNVSIDKDNDFEIGTPDSFISTFDDIVGAVIRRDDHNLVDRVYGGEWA